MPESTAPANALAATAFWVAGARARESARPDRLFSDPWAAALAGETGATWAAGQTWESLAAVLVRTRFFDDFLARAVAEQDVRQVVLVAAGLDTRAYRTRWPAGTRLFELERPEVLRYKEDVLAAADARPTCARQAVGVDLAAEWSAALLDAGYEPGRPSVWLLEGILFYLPDEGIARLLDEVTRLAAPGSHLGFDVFNRATLTAPLLRAWLEMQARAGSPWIGALDDPVAFLAPRGWAAATTQPGEEGAHFGRWPYPTPPRAIPGLPRFWWVTGRRVPV